MGLSDVFSLLDSGYASLAGTQRQRCIILIVPCQVLCNSALFSKYDIILSLYYGDVGCSTTVQRGVIIFPIVFSKHLVAWYFETI